MLSKQLWTANSTGSSPSIIKSVLGWTSAYYCIHNTRHPRLSVQKGTAQQFLPVAPSVTGHVVCVICAGRTEAAASPLPLAPRRGLRVWGGSVREYTHSACSSSDWCARPSTLFAFSTAAAMAPLPSELAMRTKLSAIIPRAIVPRDHPH